MATSWNSPRPECGPSTDNHDPCDPPVHDKTQERSGSLPVHRDQTASLVAREDGALLESLVIISDSVFDDVSVRGAGALEVNAFTQALKRTHFLHVRVTSRERTMCHTSNPSKVSIPVCQPELDPRRTAHSDRIQGLAEGLFDSSAPTITHTPSTLRRVLGLRERLARLVPPESK